MSAADKQRLDSLATGGNPGSQQAFSYRVLSILANDGPFESFSSGMYREILPAGSPFPTSDTWYSSATKEKKIVEQIVTYNANKTVATTQWTVYDEDGATPLKTATDTITYASIFELNRTRTII